MGAVGFKFAKECEVALWERLSSRDLRSSRLESRSHERIYEAYRLYTVAGIRQVKKMYNKKLLTALVALIFILGATMAIGQPVDFVSQEKLFSDKPIFDASEEASITLAQNDKRNQKEGEKPESGSATGESDAETDDDKKSSEEESKPLKPFVPSEQIAGEQAVDFPADI